MWVIDMENQNVNQNKMAPKEKQLFTISDLERAWKDGYNKTHSEWESFKVEIVMEKVYQTLQNGLEKIEENQNK